MTSDNNGVRKTRNKGIQTCSDLSGRRFDRLLVLGVGPSGRKGYWHLRCDCGTEKEVRSDSLTSGKTRSCGCLNRETKNLEHGHARKGARSGAYKSWSAMMTRVFNPNHCSYPRYGGRGIRVCERWLKFENFLQDMGERPAGYEIDRIDLDGDYSPENCRWIPRELQSKHRSTTVRLTFDGKTLIQADWARSLRISGATLRYLLSKYPMEHVVGHCRTRQRELEAKFIGPRVLVVASHSLCFEGG